MANRAVTDTRWSGNYSGGRPYGDPNQIVIHHWGSDGQSHQGVVDYLCRYDGSSSAHYVASAGRVTQLVSDNDRAWHAGPSGNPRGIGIECRPEMSDGDWETVADLVAAIREEWGDLPVVGHRDHMSTACPGRWYPHLAALSARADAIRAGAPAHTTSEEDELTSDEKRKLDALYYLAMNNHGAALSAVDSRTATLVKETAALKAQNAALAKSVGDLSKAIESLAAQIGG